MSLNETTVNAHRIRFARLIDVLLADAAIEPQYQPSRLREWLAWAHGACWHLHAVLESYCHVTAAKPGSLLSPFAYREIKEMLDYFDEVFKDRDSPEIERVGVPFPTLTWSEAAVLYKQTQPNTRLAVGLPMYTTVPTYLDDYRSLPTIVSKMSWLVDRLLEASRDKPSKTTDGPDDTMPALVHDVVEERKKRRPDRIGVEPQLRRINVDNLYDIREDMTAEDRATMDAEVKPMKMTLLKVSLQDLDIYTPLDNPPTSNMVEAPQGAGVELAQAPM
ncbi:hypothetical protein FOMPIDRAFT_1053448 [Fomitopsis schrenkii]|uniref:Uncharacterized protein n=1 Tax=Fomitopsis schrenkii TaxID=2126942 RepID=S8F364_FOMSC|nr:hypothetical protein FOMPIDRAFT_1053448 [Fomitopsis schrenkii]